MAGEAERWSLDLDLDKAEGQLNRFASRMTGAFTAGSLAVSALEKVIGSVTSTLQKGWGDALLYETTNKRLEMALRATGHEVDRNVAAFNAQSNALEGLLGVSDETIRAMQSQALMMGVTADKMEDTIKAAITLSKVMAARGGGEMSVEMALLQLKKAQEGTVPETMKLLGAFKDLSSEELRNVDVVKLVNDQYGDMMAADMDTTAGSVKRLSTAWDNMGEAIAKAAAAGGIMAGALDVVAERVQNIANLVEQGEIGKLIKGYLSAVTLPFTGLAGAAGYAAGWLGFDDANAPAAAPSAVGPGGANGPDLRLGEMEINVTEEARKRNERARAQLAAVQEYKGDTGITYGGFGGSGEMPEYASGVDRETELIESRAERRMKTEEMLTAYIDEQAQRRLSIVEKEAQRMASVAEKEAQQFGQLMTQGMGMAMGAVESFVDGGLLGFAKFAMQSVASVGAQLMAIGWADQAKAAGMNAFMPGSGVALAAAASAEIALGSSMAAGGFLGSLGIQVGGALAKGDKWNPVTGMESGGGGGDGGAGSGGSGGFSGSSGYNTTRFREDQAPQPITIVLQGPVYDGAAAGVAIMQKINEARRQGVLK